MTRSCPTSTRHQRADPVTSGKQAPSTTATGNPGLKCFWVSNEPTGWAGAILYGAHFFLIVFTTNLLSIFLGLKDQLNIRIRTRYFQCLKATSGGISLMIKCLFDGLYSRIVIGLDLLSANGVSTC
jgi:hypothetical protein